MTLSGRVPERRGETRDASSCVGTCKCQLIRISGGNLVGHVTDVGTGKIKEAAGALQTALSGHTLTTIHGIDRLSRMDMIMATEQTLHRIELVVLATDTQFHRIVDDVERLLCPDPDHLGPCVTPWSLTVNDESGFDDEERAHYWSRLAT